MRTHTCTTNRNCTHTIRKLTSNGKKLPRKISTTIVLVARRPTWMLSVCDSMFIFNLLFRLFFHSSMGFDIICCVHTHTHLNRCLNVKWQQFDFRLKGSVHSTIIDAITESHLKIMSFFWQIQRVSLLLTSYINRDIILNHFFNASLYKDIRLAIIQD